MRVLDNVRATSLETHLIIHYGILYDLDETSKFVRILGAIHEPRVLDSLFQWDEILKNIIQFPGRARTSDFAPSTPKRERLPFEDPLLFFDFAVGSG